MRKKIGIIGFGNMGSAIAEQLKANYSVYCFDKYQSKIQDAFGIELSQSIVNLVDEADVLILAVKPQDFEAVLSEIKFCKHLSDKLFISIAAGISTQYLERKLGVVRIVRAMPNMPLKIGAGLTCLSRGQFASEEDLDFADDIFDYMGGTLRIEESFMNAATAVSGSGPAYVCSFLEKNSFRPDNLPEDKSKIFLIDFQEAAKSVGFNPEAAAFLAHNVFHGTIKLLKKNNILPHELRKQVTSKGGTTEAAFMILDHGGSLKDALRAAVKRAEDLSKG